MDPLATWDRGEHSAPVRGTTTTYPTYRKGSGPGVVVIHEIPGPTPAVVGFGEELVAAELHAELGGPGVGALGMCFTGGFALAMMVDEAVAAPVLCQPSVPFPAGRARAADLNLSPDDLARVRERAAGGCAVLGLRFASDKAVGTRFDTLDDALGDAFIRVDLEGRGHSTVTEHRQQAAVDRVLAFLDERLRPAG